MSDENQTAPQETTDQPQGDQAPAQEGEETNGQNPETTPASDAPKGDESDVPHTAR